MKEKKFIQSYFNLYEFHRIFLQKLLPSTNNIFLNMKFS
jgi:hypothetical protein